MFLDHPWENFLPWNWEYRMIPPQTKQVAKYVITQNLHIKKSLFDVIFSHFFTTRFLITGAMSLSSFYPYHMTYTIFIPLWWHCPILPGVWYCTYLLRISLFILFLRFKKKNLESFFNLKQVWISVNFYKTDYFPDQQVLSLLRYDFFCTYYLWPWFHNHIVVERYQVERQLR